ncbi:MAG: zinc ribbon domain-containing protein [Methanobacteriaceae archaeon]|nr:zinc ribbon domain-containing protein [Methanobacteriaceae archaeon]
MYCPECGVILKNHENLCHQCGRDLHELYELEKKKTTKLIMVIVGVICVPIIIITTYFYLGMTAIYLSLLVLSVAFLVRLFHPVESFNDAKVGKCCPNCYNMYLNVSFCIKCGYDLRGIIGFSTLTGYDLKIHEKYIKVSRYYLNQGRRIYVCTGKYALMHIRNLHVSYKCGRFLSRLPCLVFEYNPLYIDSKGKPKDKYTFRITILEKLAPQIEEAISDPLFQKARSNDPYPAEENPLPDDYDPEKVKEVRIWEK